MSAMNNDQDLITKKVLELQKTIAAVQEVEDEQKKLYEKRSQLVAQLAVQQEELMHHMNKKKQLTIDFDSMPIKPELPTIVSNESQAKTQNNAPSKGQITPKE